MDGEKNNNFEELNIFNEIKEDLETKTDIESIKKEKNIFDYLTFYGKIFKFLNYILVIILIVFSTYVFIRKSENISENAYLNLFCPLFLGAEASNYVSGNNCSSIKAYNNKITNDINALRQNQFNRIVEEIPKVYELTSSNTKEKDFLLVKTKDRLKVLKIIEEFERMKNDYNFVDKNKIMCKDIEIDSNNVLKTNCEAYSTEWDEILGNDGVEKVNGTSLSVAVSFLNYIQTKSTNFTLINKTKSFSQESTNFGFYIYKTNFILEMKYNGDNLSF